MANCRSVGASRKGSQGLSPTGKDWLSWWVRASKKGEYEAAATEVSITVWETAPLSLTKTLKLTGRPELASLETEAARSGQRIWMRSRSGWGAGKFLGA